MKTRGLRGWSILFFIVVLIGLFYYADTGLQDIVIAQDSIYVDSRSSTNIEVDNEVEQYEEIYITINKIYDSGYKEIGPYVCGSAPASVCGFTPDPVSGFSNADREDCCKKKGYKTWDITNCKCFKDVMVETGSISIEVAGEEVYYWDGDGDFPTQSDNIADIVNNFCMLGLSEQEVTNCFVPVDVFTESGYGYLNIGLDWSGRIPLELTIPADDPSEEPNDNELPNDVPDEFVDDVEDGNGVLGEELLNFISQNLSALGLALLFILLIGGILWYGIKK